MITIDENKCIGCGVCAKDCFTQDIVISEMKAIPKRIRCIECGHCVAVCPVNAITLDEYDMTEIIDYNLRDFEIDPIVYLNSLKFRRTIRQYTKQQVEVEKINHIIEAGRYSPTGGNLQNVSYYVIQEDIKAIKEMAIKELYEMATTIDYSNASEQIQWYSTVWKRLYKEYMEEPSKDGLFFDAGTLILVVSDSPINGAIASAHMETMIYAQSLGMVYSGFFVRAVANSSHIKEYLGIEENKQIVTCMVIGYPDVTYKRTVPRKKPIVIRK